MLANLTDKEKKIFVQVFVLALVTVFVPSYFEVEAAKYSRSQSLQKDELILAISKIDNQLEGIEDQRKLLQENRENYERWVEMGVVGDQDLVSRVKALDEIRNRRKLYELSYDFSEDSTLPPSASPITEDSTVNIKILTMNLKLPMLHDMDSLMLLESMEQDIQAFFFPVDCYYKRLENEFSLVQRKNMESECRVDWFSVNDPESNLVGKDKVSQK